MSESLLKVSGLTKRYPGVVALNRVHLEIQQGEVHALVGENGAGKSTLIKCIAGAIKPDEGEILFDGEKMDKCDPHYALRRGISVIYQEFNLVPYRTVAENIMLGRYPMRGIVIDEKKLKTEAQAIMDELGVPIDINTKVANLTVGFQQLVEIAKAVSREAKLIIMDEPSAALTNNELKYLFKIVERLRAKNVSILYISHRLEEIFDICDRVTIFRDGRYVDALNVSDTNQQQLIRLMVNRELTQVYPHTRLPRGKKILEVKNLKTPLLKEISFDAYEGEILGFSGLVGSGRTETVRAIFGADPIDGGTFVLDGKPYVPSTPQKAIRSGIGLISENRKEEGLALGLSIRDNTVLASLRGVSNGVGVVSSAKVNSKTRDMCEKLQVKTPSYDQLVGNLSGGNQQKVVVAKWLVANCKVIIFDEPTRGIDVGAKYEIYLLMQELLQQGKVIIMISSDMPEMLGMADRIIVMHEGEKMAELDREQADQEIIMQYASGLKE